MSRNRRSNRRFGSAAAHVASLCCISLIIKGLHLIRSVSLHFKQSELFPFAMWQAFPAADYYGNSASMMDIRVNSLGIPSSLPSFVCWTSARWGGCRSQSFSLRSASRYRCRGLAVFSPRLPADTVRVCLHSDPADLHLQQRHQYSAC
jgi:hypothetical protein